MSKEEITRVNARLEQEKVALAPILERLNEVVRSGENEVKMIQSMEYRPLIAHHRHHHPQQQDDHSRAHTSEEEGKNVSAIEGLKKRMLSSYTDFAYRSSAEGGLLWSKIVSEARQKKN
jgi:uncharacterized protein YaaN involved in tellurite resistance